MAVRSLWVDVERGVPLASIGAASHWSSRWARVAGAVRIGSVHLEREAVRHPLRLRHLFPPDHRSAFSAVG